jgi:tetratricopeptide (TPR) repeat protein
MNWKLVALLIAIFFLIFSTVFPKALYNLGKEFVDKISFIKLTDEQKLLNQQQKVEIQKQECYAYITAAANDITQLERAEIECNEFISQSSDINSNIEILTQLKELCINNGLKEKQIEITEKIIRIADSNEVKMHHVYQLLMLYFSDKNIIKAEEKANYLITNAKDMPFSLFALYFMAKIQEEKGSYELAITYYDEYITEYEKRKSTIPENDPFISKHTIDSIRVERDLVLQNMLQNQNMPQKMN